MGGAIGRRLLRSVPIRTDGMTATQKKVAIAADQARYWDVLFALWSSVWQGTILVRYTALAGLRMDLSTYRNHVMTRTQATATRRRQVRRRN